MGTKKSKHSENHFYAMSVTVQINLERGIDEKTAINAALDIVGWLDSCADRLVLPGVRTEPVDIYESLDRVGTGADGDVEIIEVMTPNTFPELWKARQKEIASRVNHDDDVTAKIRAVHGKH